MGKTGRSGVLIGSVVRTSRPNDPGGPCDTNRPSRTEFGVLIDSVIHTSGQNGPGCPGDIHRPPWTGSLELVNRHKPDGQGGPGDEDRPTRTGSDDPIYSVLHVNSVNSVVRVSGPVGSVSPCAEDNPPRNDSDSLHCILPPGTDGPGVTHGDSSEGIVVDAPGPRLLSQ